MDVFIRNMKETKAEMNVVYLPLEWTQTPASNNKEIWLYPFNFMTDDFLGVTFLNPCFTSNLIEFEVNTKEQQLQIKKETFRFFLFNIHSRARRENLPQSHDIGSQSTPLDEVP